MKCPACGQGALSPVQVGDVELDVCEGGCGGVWFDHLEFKKMDEPHEHSGSNLMEVAIDPSVVVDHAKKRKCPKCPDTTMFRQFFSPKRQIEVDHCRVCGGHWLDLGELHSVRAQFKSEKEKQVYAHQAFDELFREPLLAMKQESEEALKSARTVARMLKFICPSYYIPGKQKWGAW
jgi:Zn-finger nucleic acid-binding protein